METYAQIEKHCVAAVKAILLQNGCRYFRKYSHKFKNGRRSHKFFFIIGLTNDIRQQVKNAVLSITVDYTVLQIESPFTRNAQSLTIRPIPSN